MGNEQTPPAANSRSGRTSVWLLGALSVFGLVGFGVMFGLIVARTASPPQAAVSAMTPPAVAQPGPPGDRGPPGPPGPRGPAGDPGIRIVRADCATGNCTVACDEDEVMLTAHCGGGRPPSGLSNRAQRALPVAEPGQGRNRRRLL